jgi:hypothetical protein
MGTLPSCKLQISHACIETNSSNKLSILLSSLNCAKDGMKRKRLLKVVMIIFDT